MKSFQSGEALRYKVQWSNGKVTTESWGKVDLLEVTWHYHHEHPERPGPHKHSIIPQPCTEADLVFRYEGLSRKRQRNRQGQEPAL